MMTLLSVEASWGVVILSLRYMHLVTCRGNIMRFFSWLRWRTGLNLTCIYWSFFYWSWGAHVSDRRSLLYGHFYSKICTLRIILGVTQATFILEIQLVFNIHQNRSVFKCHNVLVVALLLNHKRVDMINGWERTHEQNLSSKNR